MKGKSTQHTHTHTNKKIRKKKKLILNFSKENFKKIEGK